MKIKKSINRRLGGRRKGGATRGGGGRSKKEMAKMEHMNEEGDERGTQGNTKRRGKEAT